MKVAASKQFVLDASVALAWCFPDESSPYTEAILDRLASGGAAIVPAIWPFEVANALLVAERRGRVSMAQVTNFLQRITNLPIALDPSRVDRAFGPILLAARSEKLTEYDAAYLELAIRESSPLATLDAELRRGARATGVALITL